MLRGAAVEHKAPHAAPFMLQVSDHRLPGWPYCPSLPTKNPKPDMRLSGGRPRMSW